MSDVYRKTIALEPQARTLTAQPCDVRPSLQLFAPSPARPSSFGHGERLVQIILAAQAAYSHSLRVMRVPVSGRVT